jgi:hypothetical protein
LNCDFIYKKKLKINAGHAQAIARNEPNKLYTSRSPAHFCLSSISRSLDTPNVYRVGHMPSLDLR